MTLEKEKEMIKSGLEKLRKVPNFEELLLSPPPELRHNPLISNSGKNLVGTDGFRKLGNKLFNKDDHDACSHYSIIQEYNKSIAVSPANTESLAMGYGNRSALLEHVSNYKDCISAVDEALSSTKTAALKVKLLCRKAKCYAALGLPKERTYLSEARFWLNKFDGEEAVKKRLTELIIKTENLLLKIGFQSPLEVDKKVTALADLIYKSEIDGEDPVEIAYSEKWGKHLIAARDIRPGEILVREKAFSTSLDQEQIYLYCCHCGSFMWHMVPCDSCASCCFCSDQCKAEARKHYHELECDIVSTLNLHYLTLSEFCKISRKPVTRLGLKIFLIALKQTGNVRKLRASLKSFDEGKVLKDFPANDFRHVYSLFSETENGNSDELVMDAALYLVILAKSTSLFYDIFDPDDNFSLKKLMRNDDILYAGALILKFCAISDSNALKNQRLPDCRQLRRCEEIACGPISWSFGLKTSLTCRGCIPNVRRCLTDKNQIILYSILPIKKGAQIFDSHLSIFDEVPRLERQEVFRNRQGFTCECQACTESWPDISLKSGIVEYYSEAASTLSEKDLKLYRDFLSISDVKTDLSLAERISKFSELIEYAVRELPLPSKLTAFLIQGFVSFIEKSHGCSEPHMSDKCST